MPQTICTTVYTFDELTDAAKNHARDWYRDGREGSDLQHVIEDAARMGEILGFSFKARAVPLLNGTTRYEPCIWWSLGYTQSDGAWIEADYAYAKGAHRTIREEAPTDTDLHDLADRLLALQKRHRYQLTATVRDSDRRSMDLDLDAPHNTDGTVYAEMRSIVEDFEQWIYRQLRTEDEYQSSDEQVDETIRANEYTFTEDGRRKG
jgi:hypothetical protein